MKEIRHLKTMKNKRNLNTKWLLLQNDQNAETTLLHSHDEIRLSHEISLVDENWKHHPCKLRPFKKILFPDLRIW